MDHLGDLAFGGVGAGLDDGDPGAVAEFPAGGRSVDGGGQRQRGGGGGGEEGDAEALSESGLHERGV